MIVCCSILTQQKCKSAKSLLPLESHQNYQTINQTLCWLPVKYDNKWYSEMSTIPSYGLH